MTPVTGDWRLQSDVLEDLSDAHRYRRWLADLARPYLGEHPVEIGSGNGDYALEWAGEVVTFTATEAETNRYRALCERFAGHPVITVRHLLLGAETVPEPPADGATAASGKAGDAAGSHSTPGEHSAAVAFNVLEHIPDDVAALRAMAGLVRTGGAVVLVVPAFPSAMSRFDRAIGHQRRYTRASLGAALAGAGLHVERLRYLNPIGLLSWYVSVKALRMAPRNGAALRLYDRTIVPLARRLDHPKMPFGQSIFAVARVGERAGARVS